MTILGFEPGQESTVGRVPNQRIQETIADLIFNNEKVVLFSKLV